MSTKPAPALIIRRNQFTGELAIPICWNEEWYIMPLFAIAYGPKELCFWRKGWRKVARFIGDTSTVAASVIEKVPQANGYGFAANDG